MSQGAIRPETARDREERRLLEEELAASPVKGKPLAAAAAQLPARRRLRDPRARRPDGVDAPAAHDRERDRAARGRARRALARARRGGRRRRGVRARLARDGAPLELRAGERADRPAQPQLPGGGAAADGSAHARLRQDQRPPLRAASRSTSGGSSSAGRPISARRAAPRDPASDTGGRRGDRGALRRESRVSRAVRAATGPTSSSLPRSSGGGSTTPATITGAGRSSTATGSPG